MNQTQNNNDDRAIAYLIIAVVVSFAVIVIVQMLAALVVVCLCAGALYFGAATGLKVSKDSEIWESRRIAKHNKLEAARERERQHFASQGLEFMTAVVDNHYDDQARNLYEKKDRLNDVAQNVKKVRSIFKK
jgi:hypothetical protein